MSGIPERESALSDVIFALRHGSRGTDVDILERGTNAKGTPYLDIAIDDHPYRLALEDLGETDA